MRFELLHLAAIAGALLTAIGALWAALRSSEKRRADESAAAVKQRGEDVREMVSAVMADVAALNALRAVCETQRVEHATLLAHVDKLAERIEGVAGRLEDVSASLAAGREAAAKAIRDDLAVVSAELRGVRTELVEARRR